MVYNYVLPKRLKKKGNIGGVKLRDVAFAVLMIILGITGYFALKAASAHVIYAAVIAVSVGLAGVILIIPQKYEENFLIKIGRKRKFKDEQQRFYYRRGTI